MVSLLHRATIKKLNVFGRPVKSEPHQTWHGDRGPPARFCTSKIKLLEVLRIVSPLGGAENSWETRSL